MNDPQKINELQQELNELRKEMLSQQQRFNELQQQLWALGGKPSQPPLRSSAPPRPVYASPNWSMENFIGLRLIHFIGIIVLVIGLSIGVKYAIDRQLISENLRILLAYGAGLVLYLLSLRLKKKYTTFSAILFSGGMASLYFTTYGAHVYYNMFSFGVAFAMMILLTVYASYEAIRYNRQEIALLGLIGAYGIPFLISKNNERADLFFLYITMINIGVIFLTIRKDWKMVGRIAQILTWILFIGWASMRYKPATQETFAVSYLGLFFGLFLFCILSFRILKKKALTLNDTYLLIVHNIALYFASLFVFGIPGLENLEDHLALITLLVSIFVGVQSFFIYQQWKEEHLTVRMLSSLALTLFVLFIAFNWDGFIVTLLWLLTAVIVFTLGFVVRSVATRMTAIILIGLTLAKLLLFDSLTFTTVQKVIAYLVLGVLLLVVSFFYQKFRQQLFSEEERRG